MRSIYNWAARLVASLRASSEFTCSDCEKWEQCGQPPTETCIVKAAQLARGTGNRRGAPGRSRSILGPLDPQFGYEHLQRHVQ